VKNCVKCHNGAAATATATSGKNVTPDGDNWKKVPSRAACGACHNGIDFAKNTGVTLSDYAAGLTTSTTAHIGGAKADDTQCVLCHSAADIPVYHLPVAAINNTNVKTVRTYTANPDALPAGAFKLEYVISSVAVDSARKVSVAFQIKKDGAAVNFGTYNATTNPNIVPNTVGGPSIAIGYNVTQDGNTSPADFNARMSAPAIGISAPTVSNSAATPPSTFTAPTTSTNLWVNPTGVTASGITWTMTGPDATNTYTIKSSLPLPASTTMLSAFMYGAMTQTNLSSYPYAAASVADFSSYKNAAGTTTSYVLTKPGLIIAVDNASKSVTTTGFTARRTIVDNAKCNACHDQLGLFSRSAFHGGGRNDGTICNICHTPNAVNSGWSYSANTYIHGIHGASKRTTKYTFATDWSTVTYPGALKNCEGCHVAGSYDYAASASAAAATKLLYNTVGTGTTGAATANTAPYIAQTAGTGYGSGFSYSTTTGAVVTTEAASTTLVTSPIAAACFSCHDSSLAMNHMKQNGGAVYAPRSTAFASTETCLLCHGTGKTSDIKLRHGL
jgi:OmcA/MtrC family decaheme c-type cytochrome